MSELLLITGNYVKLLSIQNLNEKLSSHGVVYLHKLQKIDIEIFTTYLKTTFSIAM